MLLYRDVTLRDPEVTQNKSLHSVRLAVDSEKLNKVIKRESKGAYADPMGGKASATIVVRGVSRRVADPIRHEFWRRVAPTPITRSFKKKIFLIMVICFYAAYLYGCAEGNHTIKESAARRSEGFYHKINSDETLWKISKIYGIEPDEILRANDLNEASSIKPGRVIYIPAGKTIGIEAGCISKPFLLENNFIWPLKGRVVSFYGMKNRGAINGGIDIEAEENSYVLASRSGRVIFTTFLDNDLFKGFENKQKYRIFKYFGHVVIIDHEDGFLTLYANNSEILVKEGNMVKQGEFISKAGMLNKGVLHFEIRKGYKIQNPFHFLP